MKKNEEMISLNSNSMDFKEEMSLDEMLERLNPMELKSVKAGGAICRSKCSCHTMDDNCGTRCDGNCVPDCSQEECVAMSCWTDREDVCFTMDEESCFMMDPT